MYNLFLFRMIKRLHVKKTYYNSFVCKFHEAKERYFTLTWKINTNSINFSAKNILSLKTLFIWLHIPSFTKYVDCILKN